MHREDVTSFSQSTQRSPCTEKLLHKASSLHREAFAQTAFTQSKLLHREAFTHSKLLHRGAFTQSKLLHREALHTASFYTEKLLHRMRQNWEISAAKAPFATFMQPLHFTIYDSQLQKTLKVFCTQPQQRGTWTQPFHGDLQRLSCKHTIELRATATQIAAPKLASRRPRGINDDFEALFKRNFKRKLINTKIKKKSAAKAPLRNFHATITCDLRLSAAKHNSITHAATAARNLGAAIPLRSAETEWPNIKDLQWTTVQHNALMHQFHCTNCLISCKTMILHSSFLRREKVKRKPQFHCTRISSMIPRQSDDAWDRRAKRAYFSPQRNLRSPEKTQCFVQILTFKSHPWCSSSNAIC